MIIMSAQDFIDILKRLQETRLDYERRRGNDLINDDDVDNIDMLQELVYTLMKNYIEP